MSLVLSSLSAEGAESLSLGSEFFPTNECNASVDMSVYWHILHVVLTESVEPIDSPLSLLHYDSGYRIDENNEYWFFSASKIRSFDEALRRLSDDELRRRFELHANGSSDVYRGESLFHPGTEYWNCVSENIPDLRRFAQTCAENGSAAVAYFY
jgi:hypothetical protein